MNARLIILSFLIIPQEVFPSHNYSFYCEMPQYMSRGTVFNVPCSSKIYSLAENLTIGMQIIDLETNQTFLPSPRFFISSTVPFLMEKIAQQSFSIPAKLPLHQYALQAQVFNQVTTANGSILKQRLEESFVPLYFNLKATSILVTLNKEEDTYFSTDWVSFSILLSRLSRRPITTSKYANIFIWKTSPEYFLVKKWVSIEFNALHPVVSGVFKIIDNQNDTTKTMVQTFEIFVVVDERDAPSEQEK